MQLRPLFDSFCELCRRSGGYWGTLVSGAVVGVTGTVMSLYAMTVSGRLVAAVGLLLLLVSAFRAFHDVRLERDVLADAAKPKFEFVYPAAESDRRRPYIQELSVNDVTTRVIRIGVRSLSSSDIPNLRVVLAAAAPEHAHLFPDHALRVMGELAVNGYCNLPPVDGAPSRWFDVAEESWRGNSSNEFAVCYAEPSIVGPIAHSPYGDGGLNYRITLRAEGGGYSESRDFRLSKRFDAEKKRWLPVELEPL